jgi:hypothetical protein
VTPGGEHEQQPPLPGLEIKRPEPPPELVERAHAFVARKEWIFAKTMADNPHFYVVLYHQRGADRDGYLALRELIMRWGWNRRWHGSTWRTYDLDGFSYWTITPVINRKPVEEAGWED